MANATEKTEKKAPAEDRRQDPAYWEELVELELPLMGPDGRKDEVVCVNGETLRIQRGVPVQIKRKLAEALRLSVQEQRAAMEASEAAVRRGRKPLAEL